MIASSFDESNCVLGRPQDMTDNQCEALSVFRGQYSDGTPAIFVRDAGYVRTLAEPLLLEFFGERCPDFCDACVCCRRWKALDDLLANPWADKTEAKHFADGK
jgi:hypothetical protein